RSSISVTTNYHDLGYLLLPYTTLFRSIGEEHAIRIHRQYVSGRGLRRHHSQVAATLSQQTQNVAFYAVIVRHHLKFWFAQLAVAFTQRPVSFGPLIRGFGADHFGQIHTVQAGESLGFCQRFGYRRF